MPDKMLLVQQCALHHLPDFSLCLYTQLADTAVYGVVCCSQAQMQALAAAQAQAQLQRQMLAQQQALLGGGVAAVAAPAAMVAAAQMGSAAVAATAGTANDTQARKSREIYIGNLAIGTVTIEMLTELFNAALAGMVPDPVTNPPVLNVKMDTTGD
jgi:splicing factor U2AF subunit